MPSEESSQSNNVSQPHQTDAEVFLLLQTGQTNALATLYDRHAGLVYGIALNLLGNTQEAEDLTQDVFLILTKKCSFDPKRGTLRTFLAILTRSRAIDRLRAQARNQERLLKQALDGQIKVASNNPLEEFSQVERVQEVQVALSQLSSQEQEVLKMAYYEGLSQSEISTRLDTAIGTVKSRARRGLLKLRQALTDFMEKS